MENFAHNLFLLMVNLSQLRNRKRIADVFLDAISQLLNCEAYYTDEQANNDFPIQTKNNAYGYLHIDKALGENAQRHLQNAVQMLAVLMERQHQKELLENEKLLFEHLVNEKTAHLEESQATFRALSENTPDIILRLSTNLQVIFVNQQIESFTGLSADSLINQPFTEAGLYPEILNELLKAVNKVQASRSIEHVTTNHQFDNKSVWLEWRFFPEIGKNKNLHGILGSAKDITREVKYKNDLIEAKERAERADKLKTAFLSNISHEIRTPLNAILGFSDLLVNKSLDDQEKENFVDIIKENSSQLLKTIDELLDISRIEAGAVEMSKQEFPVKPFLSEIEMENRELVKKSGKAITLKGNYSPELDNLRIRTDRRRLKQALNNILENARKFTSEGEISFSCTLQDDTIEFEISDTGIGIPEDKLPVIFDRFRQADEDLARQYGGNGLGLSISKGFIEFLGGSVKVQSRLEEGTTFYVHIPKKRPHNP